MNLLSIVGYCWLVSILTALVLVIVFALRKLVARTARSLRALVHIIRAANEWAEAEQAGRDWASEPHSRRFDLFGRELFDAEAHSIYTRMDYAENVLLETIKVAKEDGLDLGRFGALS